MKKKLIIGAVAVLAVMLALAGLVFFVRDVGGKNDEIKELEAKLEEMERLRDPLYAAAADREIWNVNSPAETAGEIWRDFYE